MEEEAETHALRCMHYRQDRGYEIGKLLSHSGLFAFPGEMKTH